MANAFFLLLFLTLFCAFSSPVAGQDASDDEQQVRYISDDLITYMHSGPGRNYRILGSLTAGSKVVQLQVNGEAGYVEILDEKQRTGWVEAKYVSNKASLRERLPELQERLSRANTSIDQQQQSNQLLSQRIEQLSKQNNQLSRDVQQLQSDNARLGAELNQQDQSAKMQWLTRGGLIALGGAVLGVLLTFIPRRKRRNDQWM